MAACKGGEVATKGAAFKMENIFGVGNEVFETFGIRENTASIIGIRH